MATIIGSGFLVAAAFALVVTWTRYRRISRQDRQTQAAAQAMLIQAHAAAAARKRQQAPVSAGPVLPHSEHGVTAIGEAGPVAPISHPIVFPARRRREDQVSPPESTP